MRILIAVALVLGCSSCLFRGTLTGRWVGCDPGDEVYVGLSSGTEGADEADYFSCEEGGFEMSIPAESFELELIVFPPGGTASPNRTTTIDLEGITGDYDVGVIQL